MPSLSELGAAVFFAILVRPPVPGLACRSDSERGRCRSAILEARYRALVEQIPAVVFMAYLDRGIGEAYVSPQIEATLGFSQAEWLEDPVRWYSQIHPDDKERWSVEAAEMFLTGEPLRSAYRVLARDGRVVWFHCEAKMVRREDGRPWFIHGVGFDITDLKRAEAALQEERNVALRDSGYRRRAGRRARPGRADRALQPRLRADDRVRVRRGAGAVLLGPVPGRRRSRAVQGALARAARRAAAAATTRAIWMARRRARRRIAWSSTVLPRRGRRRSSTSSRPASTSPSASGWSRRSSRSAPGSSAGSARICTTAWAST